MFKQSFCEQNMNQVVSIEGSDISRLYKMYNY